MVDRLTEEELTSLETGARQDLAACERAGAGSLLAPAIEEGARKTLSLIAEVRASRAEKAQRETLTNDLYAIAAESAKGTE